MTGFPFDTNAPPDTLFTGNWQPQFPRLNIPGMGSLGQFGGMAAQIGLSSLLSNQGMEALQFGGQQNIMDTFRAREMFRSSQRALEYGAQQDALRLHTTMEGMARMAGADELYMRRPDVQEAITRLAGTGQAILPFMARAMPEAVDRMMGVKGSQTVLNYQLFQGGRFQTDPVSGLLGYSPETSGHISRRLFEDLYGTDRKAFEMKGLGAGEAGLLFNEMSLRGMFGAPKLDERNLPSDREGPRPEPTAIRESEVIRIKDRLKEMTGAVAAMKEVFGDAGHPDAPMRQLVEGLNALTQGGVTAFDPARLKMMVRETQELARMSGVDVQSVFNMTAGAAESADRMGLARPFAALAVQGSLAYAQAFNTLGLGVTGYGALGKDEAVALDRQLRLNADKSPMTNVLSAAVALEDEFRNSAGMRGPGGKQLRDTVQAIKDGNVNALRGMSPERLAEMANAAGIDRQVAWSLYASPESTRGFAMKYDIGAVTRAMQRADIDVQLAPQLQAAFLHEGLGKQAGPLAARAAAAFWAADLGEIAKGGGARLDAIMAAMGPLGEGVDEHRVRMALDTGVHTFEQTSGQQMTAIRQLYGDNLGPETRRLRQVAERRGALADTLAGAGRGGFVKNLMDYAMNAPAGGGSILDFLGHVPGGGVERQKLVKMLTAPGSGGGAEMGEAFLKEIRQYNIMLADTTVSDETLKSARQRIDSLYGGISGLLETNLTEEDRKKLKYESIDPKEAAGTVLQLTGAKTDQKTQALLSTVIAGLGPRGQAQLGQALKAYQKANELAGMRLGIDSGPMPAGIGKQIDDEFGPGTFAGVQALMNSKGDPTSIIKTLDQDYSADLGAKLESYFPGAGSKAAGLSDKGKANLLLGLRAAHYAQGRLGLGKDKSILTTITPEQIEGLTQDIEKEIGPGATEQLRKVLKDASSGELVPEKVRKDFAGAAGEGAPTVKLEDGTTMTVTFDRAKIDIGVGGSEFSGAGTGTIGSAA